MALTRRLSAVQVVGAAVRPYELAFVAPVGGFTRRAGATVVLVDTAGRVGLGDAAPWPPTPENVARCIAELRRRTTHLDHVMEHSHFTEHSHLTEHSDAGCPEAQAAIELALLDLLAQADGVPVAALLAEDRTTQVATRVTVGALVSTLHEAERAVASGFRTVKVKLRATDLSGLAAIRRAVGPEIRLRVDANRSLRPADVPTFLMGLAALDVELIEEPSDELTSLPPQPSTAPPIFLDESARTIGALDAALAVCRPAGLVVKPALTGILGSMQLAHAAMDCGLQVVVTHSLESAVGRAGAAHVAAALGARRHADGLAHPVWTTDDVAVPLAIAGGVIDLSGVVGLGVTLRPPLAPSAPGPTDLPHPLRSAALGRPHHPALVSHSRTYTWRELDRAASQQAFLLSALGVRPGETVGVPSTLDAATAIRLHAITRLGAIAAPLGPDRRSGVALDGLDALLDDGAGEHTPAALTTVHVGSADSLPEAPERYAGVDDDQFVILTSGTTGTPKAIRLGALQVTLSAFGSAMRLGHGLDDRWLLCLPLHHVGGLMVLLRSAFGAITTVLQEHFDAARIASALDAGELTVASFVPTQLEWVLDARPDIPLPASVRALLLGGAPMSPALRQRCDRLRLPVALSWGMTETASQVATFPPGCLDANAAPLLAFSRVERLADGRARVLGPTARGSVDTRDLITVDPDGAIRVTGRADDTIISGGLNLDPAELEAALGHHPAVTHVVVVGAPDATWGERPVAAYVGALSPDELAQYAASQLPGRKVPSAFIRLDAMPVTDLGKVSRPLVKRALVALALSPQSTDLGEPT